MHRVLSRSFLSLLCINASLAKNLGRWGETIQFPLVPVAGAVEPVSGQLLVWAAYRTDTFAAGAANLTQTAVYNPADKSVKLFEVAYTQHDMFCPGISYDFSGNLLVTGGDTSAAASLFRPDLQRWTKAADTVIPRGYQSSSTLSDGRIFTIGGSWSGGLGNKHGEIWDGTKWTFLPGCRVDPMLTADREGIFRQDNHAWLFAWSNASVFQSGPSKRMNWYTMNGVGTVTSAGLRGDDSDAMAGPAVMYDAVAGKILAVGGSPDYKLSPATANANIITISKVNNTATVEKLAPMSAKRIFANSIVLADGSVFIVGGQSFGNPFFDNNASLVPELWHPDTKRFEQLASGPTPRTYHSIALLMPDGTVFSGGGGLCGDCGDRNHFDGQLFSPPYLFQSDGATPAQRPQVVSVSSSKPKVGSTISATLAFGTARTAVFSLIRMGSSTHTVNTDQRRVPLSAIATNDNTYALRLPNDPGVLLPGYWYLFALHKGVPSLAQILQITP